MRKLIVVSAALVLAACNSAPSDEPAADATTADTTVDGVDPDADAGFEAVAPGNYEVVRAGGVIDQLTINPGMTWSMVGADGSASGGTIFAQDGKNCFVTEGVDGHRCFSGEEPAADGSMSVTGDDGEVATIRPVEGFASPGATATPPA